MNPFQKKRHRQDHREFQEPATEPQAVISWGEQYLEHAHQVADGIEDQIRRLLDPSKNPASGNQPDRAANKSGSGEEKAGGERTVDNSPRRR